MFELSSVTLQRYPVTRAWLWDRSLSVMPKVGRPHDYLAASKETRRHGVTSQTPSCRIVAPIPSELLLGWFCLYTNLKRAPSNITHTHVPRKGFTKLPPKRRRNTNRDMCSAEHSSCTKIRLPDLVSCHHAQNWLTPTTSVAGLN